MDIEKFMAESKTVFFKPTENFWKALGEIPWRWKRFVDVGAGNGTLTKAMQDRGYLVHAVDKYLRDERVVDVEQLDATTDLMTFGSNDCLIFARPCHGSFVGWVLRRYIHIGEALYISDEKNIATDLFGWYHEIIARDVGEDGEVMVRILGKIGAMKSFREIRRHPADTSEWWEYKNGKYVNPAGGYFLADRGEVVLNEALRAHAGMFYDKYDPKYDDLDAGWLAPDGTFYGTTYANHNNAAYYIIGSSPENLEKLGFAHLYGEHGGRLMFTVGSDSRDWDNPPKPTPAQALVLRAKGYKLEDNDMHSEPVGYFDLTKPNE